MQLVVGDDEQIDDRVEGVLQLEAMQDHLKDIPRQMIGIVKDDPHALDNYDNFAIALLGPP